MAIRLVVRYRNPQHRLLAPTTVSVEGATEAAGSKRGERRFDVPEAEGTSVTLRFVVPAPAGAASSAPLLDLTQTLVVAAGDGAPTLRATGGAFEGRADPRLLDGAGGARLGAGIKGQKGGVFALEVDTTFLDVTAHARTTSKSPLGGAKTLAEMYEKGTDQPDVLFVLLEHTGGRPALWEVLVPFALFTDPFLKEVPALVFFRPTGDPYTDSTDADSAIERSLRYFLPPSRQSPFYGFESQPRSWLLYPRCGWAKQLARSGRQVMLVAPLPHTSDYGVLRDSRDVRGYLDSIVRTLWSTRLVGEKRDAGVKTGRMAMAGYSFGGGQLLRCLDHNQKDVDETYCFDPNDFPANVGLLEAWFRAPPRTGAARRLRMIGGFDHNHNPMIKLAARLASDDATVEPADRSHWFSDPLYLAATTHPRRPEVLDAVGTTPAPGSVSAQTNLFVVPPRAGAATNPDRTTVEAHWTEGGAPQVARLAGPMDGTNNEITGVVRFDADQVTPDLLPVKSARALAAIAAAVKDEDLGKGHKKGRIPEMRHSWAVIGGVDSAGRLDRGETFHGYLERCLSRSAFP